MTAPAKVTEIADAIVAALNGQSFTLDFEAERLQKPRYAVEDLKDLRVAVVPRRRATLIAGRADLEYHSRVDIAFHQQLADPNDAAAMDPLLTTAAEVQDYLLGDGRVASGAVCQSVVSLIDDDLLWYETELAQGVFLWVISAEYLEIA